MVRGSDGDSERKRAKRAASLPADFQPNETNNRIAQERGVDLSALLSQFVDYHTAKGSTYKDWHAALNTWIRRERVAPVAKVRHLPTVDQLELPPDGLSPEEYAAWERSRRNK